MDSYMLQTLSNAIDVINIFETEPKPLSIQDIVQRTNMNRTSVYRILYTLRSKGILELDKNTGKYSLGIKMVQLASLVLQRLDIKQIARPYLEKLWNEINETIHLVIMNEKNAIFIDKLETSNTIFMGSYIGWAAPLYCTASGKLLLSFQSEGFIDEYLETVTIEPYTYKTITHKNDFKNNLRIIREKGYSLDNEEMVEGLKCIAVPITNADGLTVASISISGPTSRMSIKQDQVIELLMEYASLVSKKLAKSSELMIRY
ncbi:IclR family transcriptional regulator [Bacillus sp. JJ1521]|uniref:IclR family transcriptional regulator n=1 Tax=Bacillus sp. JJ1521 TaxID=3122957 RepID=UPI002FFF4BB3